MCRWERQTLPTREMSNMKNQALYTIQAFALSVAMLLPAAATCETGRPIDEDAAKSLIDNALASKNPETRQQAVDSMALLSGYERFQPRIEAMLRDRDVKVRLSAIQSMTVAPGDHTVEALRKALGDSAAEVRFSAAKALFVLNDPAGKEALLSVLDGDSKTTSGIVAQRKREAARMLHDPSS